MIGVYKRPRHMHLPVRGLHSTHDSPAEADDQVALLRALDAENFWHFWTCQIPAPRPGADEPVPQVPVPPGPEDKCF